MNNNYLIYGVDKYLIDKEIDKIIKKNKIDNNSIIRYSLNEDSIDNILEDANTFNLFSDTKLIIVNDANIFTSSNDILTDKIINYLNNYNLLEVLNYYLHYLLFYLYHYYLKI